MSQRKNNRINFVAITIKVPAAAIKNKTGLEFRGFLVKNTALCVKPISAQSAKLLSQKAFWLKRRWGYGIVFYFDIFGHP
jgi:hypothetical protein